MVRFLLRNSLSRVAALASRDLNRTAFRHDLIKYFWKHLADRPARARRNICRMLFIEPLENRRLLATVPIIVDNLDPINFIKTGVWNTASGTGYAGSVFWSNLPHNGSETAAWTFNVDPGTYRISGTWHSANPAHGSNVPIQLLNGTTQIGTTTLNQQIAPNDFFDSGAWWEDMGTFSVNGILSLKMTDNADGYAIADAIRVEKLPTSVSIVDNLDPINFIKTGAWNTASGTGYAGSIFWSNLPHDGSETAAWTFNVDPGTYRVAGTWHGANPAHGSNVPISVLSGTVQIGTTTLNQSISPDDFYESGAWWENIGTFTVGSTLRVQLTDNANGYAIADAFRIEKVATAVIVDNLDPINFAKSGAWNLASGAGLGYAGSIYWSNLPHDGSETATWTFNVDPGTFLSQEHGIARIRLTVPMFLFLF